MTATLHWAIELTARSSIVHAGDTRGTVTLLRRESVITPQGPTLVPMISGNGLRGRLRRCGEELFRDVLDLEGQIPLAAAYALRNGGSLHKTSREALSGRRRAEVRALIPQIGVFGCAAGDVSFDGSLQIGKVIPHVTETQALTGVTSATSATDLVQLEDYSHLDDISTRSSTAHDPAQEESDGSPQMRYSIETFPAGTAFSSFARLDRASDLEVAFFTDVLDTFARHGQLGGRLAIGHGRVDVDARDELIAGHVDPIDWRTHVEGNRNQILEALEQLA